MTNQPPFISRPTHKLKLNKNEVKYQTYTDKSLINKAVFVFYGQLCIKSFVFVGTIKEKVTF